jgi:hypothetical protein
MKNRDFVITDGQNDLTVFAECNHCHEPFTIEGKPPATLADKDTTVSKCYCRGSSGLSFMTRCCIEINCIKRNKHYCDAINVERGKSYPVSREWSVVVTEPVKKEDDEL